MNVLPKPPPRTDTFWQQISYDWTRLQWQLSRTTYISKVIFWVFLISFFYVLLPFDFISQASLAGFLDDLFIVTMAFFVIQRIIRNY